MEIYTEWVKGSVRSFLGRRADGRDEGAGKRCLGREVAQCGWKRDIAGENGEPNAGGAQVVHELREAWARTFDQVHGRDEAPIEEHMQSIEGDRIHFPLVLYR